ncbi:CD225/dispanin family protein [Terrabacter sp. BE26]|uniref:CD225/dispanin family protein n=1 Tax=Terrabacter sp. BE26 TaxID=2898152 RepID=UPI0035BE2DF1
MSDRNSRNDRDAERETGQPDPSHDEWSAWLPQLDPPATTPATPEPSQAPPAPTPAPTLPPSAWAPPRQAYAVRFPAPPPPSVQRPPSWMGWAVLCLLVCFPIGIVAVIKAASVNTHWMHGRVDAARRASRSARIWCIAAVAVWVFSWFFLASVAHGIYYLH